jgi:hypothetical protein
LTIWGNDKRIAPPEYAEHRRVIAPVSAAIRKFWERLRIKIERIQSKTVVPSEADDAFWKRNFVKQGAQVRPKARCRIWRRICLLKGCEPMLISASRRTDIPAYYADWFFSRLQDGFVTVRNPMRFRHISRVPLTPDVVDGIVFWTKNPQPMMGRLDSLRDYVYYFQFTLTPYGEDVEPHVPPKDEVVVPTFIKLAKTVGKERMVWRYDPILLSGVYTVEYHVERFKCLAGRLAGFTEKCTVSFLDMYRSIKKSAAQLGVIEPTPAQKEDLLGQFSEIAKAAGIYIDTCAEDFDVTRLGIGRASCIDKARLERIGGYRLNIEKDKNQRPACLCAQSIDIGAYDTCQSGCLYCYANHSQKKVSQNAALHDVNSPLLFGQVTEGDVVKEREVKSYRVGETG